MPMTMDWPKGKGVAINLKGAGGFAIVHSTHEAAVFLTSCWPLRGPAFARALELICDAFAGEADDEAARLAFVAAADEADVSVQLH